MVHVTFTPPPAPPTPPPLPSASDIAKAAEQLVEEVVSAAEGAADQAGQTAAEGAGVVQGAAEAGLEVVIAIFNVALVCGALTSQIALMAVALNFLAGVGTVLTNSASRVAEAALQFGACAARTAAAVAGYVAGRELARAGESVERLRTELGRLDQRLHELMAELEALRAAEAREQEADRSRRADRGLAQVIDNFARAARGYGEIVRLIAGTDGKQDSPPSDRQATQAAAAVQRLQAVRMRLLPAVQRKLVARPDGAKSLGKLLVLSERQRLLAQSIAKAREVARYADRLKQADLKPAMKLPPARS